MFNFLNKFNASGGPAGGQTFEKFDKRIWEGVAILGERRYALKERATPTMAVVIFAGMARSYPANGLSKVFHRDLLGKRGICCTPNPFVQIFTIWSPGRATGSRILKLY